MKRGCFYDRLSVRQVQIAKLIVRGETNAEIGAHFGFSEQAITQRVRKMFDALGVWNRVQLAVLVDRHRRDCRFCKAYREADMEAERQPEREISATLDSARLRGAVHATKETVPHDGSMVL